MTAGVGISKNRDSREAGAEACQRALDRAGGRADMLIAFASSHFDQNALVDGINSAGGGAPLVGCSDAGEITNEGPATESVAVMAIQADSARFYPSVGPNVSGGARLAGQVAARAAAEAAKEKGDTLRAFVMFPDVLTGNGADAVRGVLDALGEHFPVVGGAPGDNFLFEKTYEYINGEVVSGAVGGLGLAGNFAIGVGVRHGWIPIGIPMTVTKADGAVLKEINGKPAITIYEEYFGEKAEELRSEPLARMAITYPLGLKIPEYEDEYLIRDPISVDAAGAITCAAEIPVGSEIRLMIGSKEKAVAAAEDAAHKMMNDFAAVGSRPACLLMFNCIAREKLFAQDAQDEIDAVMKIVGRHVPLLGFYTYGEQAPLGGEVHNLEKCNPRFYNETIVLFGIGEPGA